MKFLYILYFCYWINMRQANDALFGFSHFPNHKTWPVNLASTFSGTETRSSEDKVEEEERRTELACWAVPLDSWPSSGLTWITATWRVWLEDWRRGSWLALTMTICPRATHFRVRRQQPRATERWCFCAAGQCFWGFSAYFKSSN